MRRKILVVWLVVVIAYAGSIFGARVWDDGYFLGWSGFASPTRSWSRLFAGDVPTAQGLVYRPLRSVWYVVSIALWGEGTVGYHAQAIVIHGLISTGAFFLARRLSKREMVGWYSALLFAVHPIHVEAVSWITASFDLIGVGFMSAALAAHMRYRERQQRRWRIVSLSASILAVFSYELTAVIPGLIWLYDRLYIQRKKSTAGGFGAHLLVVVFYGLIRSVVLQGGKSLPWLMGSFFHTLLFAPVLFASYLRYLVLPAPLSINHSVYPGVSNFYYLDGVFDSPTVLQLLASAYMIPVGVLLVGLWLLWRCRHNRVVGFSAGWVALCLLPVLQLVPLYTVFAERYAYAASFGVCLLGGYGLSLLPGRWRQGVTLAVVTGMMAMTMGRGRVWADTLTLWTDAAESSGVPSAYVYRNLGGSRFIYHDYMGARAAYEQAARLNPHDTDTAQKLEYLRRLTTTP